MKLTAAAALNTKPITSPGIVTLVFGARTATVLRLELGDAMRMVVLGVASEAASTRIPEWPPLPGRR